MKNKQKSLRQEGKLAKKTNSKKIPASGAVRFGGFDLENSEYCIECKQTEKLFYVLKYKDLNKIREIAAKKKKNPLFIFEFTTSGRIYCLEYLITNPINPTKIVTESIKLSDNTLYQELSSREIYLEWGIAEESKYWRLRYLSEVIK
jgi:hypothetical protein